MCLPFHTFSTLFHALLLRFFEFQTNHFGILSIDIYDYFPSFSKTEGVYHLLCFGNQGEWSAKEEPLSREKRVHPAPVLSSLVVQSSDRYGGLDFSCFSLTVPGAYAAMKILLSA
jgi:hypothetical protein